MAEKDPTWEDALVIFSRQQPHWQLFVDEIRNMREHCYADLKRNYNTAEATGYKDAQVIGRITAFDDILCTLEGDYTPPKIEDA